MDSWRLIKDPGDDPGLAKREISINQLLIVNCL